ncbi:hypothetical protein DPMN_123617 [Dreissena polymorpha]|uniref:Uncharacterized protein n=2 Tax=Dreissena polymorpha TaxID=45954 RepID=A0A9D4GUS9_DREPO|nr:hypothetical protein DPMN_123617 [Dreissena polymorpha]
MFLPGRSRWTVAGILMLLAFASGGLLPKSHDKRAVPDRKNPVSTKVDNSTPPSDPVEFWKQHNHGLCDMGMVSQRNNTVCCLPTSCKPGYGLVPCNVSGTEDICQQCSEGYIQLLNVSSLDITNTDCFKSNPYNHGKCPLDDFHAVKEGSYSKFWPYSCECAVERCLWKEPHYSSVGTCETVTTCPAHQQLNKSTGKCELCPWYADKDQPGCWPCVINVTLLRLGQPDPNSPKRWTTTTTTSGPSPELPLALSQQVKSDSPESPLGHTTTHIALFSIAVVVALLFIVVSVAICRKYQSNPSACPNWIKDISSLVRGPSQGSTNDVLSTRILPQTIPSSSSDRRASHSPIEVFIPSDTGGLQTRGAQSLLIDPRPMVHNSTHFPTPCRGSLINQGQINGVSAYMGDNQDKSCAMESDTEREPLLPSTLAETQLISRLYKELSNMKNTNGSSSRHGQSALSIPEELNEMYCTLNSEISMEEDIMGVTARSSAGELAVHEAHSSDGSRSSSTRVAALFDDVSTNRTKDLKAIGVEPSREETVLESEFTSGAECVNKKCKGNNANNGNDNSRAGGGSTINFNAPINYSVININIDGGAVRIGGEEELGRRQDELQRLQGRAVAARVSSSTMNETVGAATTLPCNDMNAGISALMSSNENGESCQLVSKDILPYNISLDKKDNKLLSDVDEESHDEKSCNELKKESCHEVEGENKANSDEAASQGVPARPVVRVSPMVHSNSSRNNINHGNSYRHNSGDMAVSIDNSSISSGYMQAHMSEPHSNTTQALTSEQTMGTPSSNRANGGLMSPSTALQMEELKYWRQVSQTVPKTIDCDAGKRETTVDLDADQRETTAVRPGQEEFPDPDQTETKELAADEDC